MASVVQESCVAIVLILLAAIIALLSAIRKRKSAFRDALTHANFVTTTFSVKLRK
jgi:hypothetical protein